MNRITKGTEGELIVPDQPIIPYITGDGVGKEIIPAMMKIVDTAIRKVYGTKRQIKWKEVLAGENAFKQTGSWLPVETLEKFDQCMVGIKGPIDTLVSDDARYMNEHFCQLLNLNECVRPIRWYIGVTAPIIAPEKVNITVFRKSAEDTFSGIEWEASTAQTNKICEFLKDEMGVTSLQNTENVALGIKYVSKDSIRQLVKDACQYALDNNMPSVTLVHKSNTLPYTEGSFRNWGYELMKSEFADAIVSKRLIVKECSVDTFMQNSLFCPEEYSLVVAMSLTGELIANQLAAMIGGAAIVPEANINYTTGKAVFQATHGALTSLAGKNIANPCSITLSAAMMLSYMGWQEAADLITRSLEHCFEDARAPFDLARYMPRGIPVSTTEFTHDVIERINNG